MVIESARATDEVILGSYSIVVVVYGDTIVEILEAAREVKGYGAELLADARIEFLPSR